MEPVSLFMAFRGACSIERFAPYKSGRSEIDALTLYVWNIALSEALYPSLQNLEIALRNRIDTAITTSYSDSEWFRDPAIIVDPRARDSVEQAGFRIEDRGETVTPPAIIAELNFGFWSGLLTVKYDPVIWKRPDVLKNAFPHMSTYLRTRKLLFQRFDSIRELRNHVFHHEAIWELDLKTEHANIIESLGWLDPSLHTVTKVLDRFPETFTEDRKRQLKEKLMGACPVETKVLLAARRAVALAQKVPPNATEK
jgi:hypothetical protein